MKKQLIESIIKAARNKDVEAYQMLKVQYIKLFGWDEDLVILTEYVADQYNKDVTWVKVMSHKGYDIKVATGEVKSSNLGYKIDNWQLWDTTYNTVYDAVMAIDNMLIK